MGDAILARLQTLRRKLERVVHPRLRRSLRNLRNISALDRRVEELERLLERAIVLEYATSSTTKPRWTADRLNPYVLEALRAKEQAYRERLFGFTKYFDQLARIPVTGDENALAPAYRNDYFSGLDSVSLYCFLAELRAHTFIEIGSGHSTKFARRSIVDNGLRTRLVSIDPEPRDTIDRLCDEAIRAPLEEVDLSLFDRLAAGDIVFFDGSHRSSMNSDVTVFFLEVMPRLRPGVVVHLHDIYLPLDYPEDWAARYYNEQYLLGALLVNDMRTFEVLLPNMYVTHTPHLYAIVNALWESEPKTFAGVYRPGASFWMRKL